MSLIIVAGDTSGSTTLQAPAVAGSRVLTLPTATGTLVDTTTISASTGSTLVGTTNGGTGSVTRTVASKLNDTVSVKDFGAVGDGVTDDTAAWTSLITAYPSEFIACVVPKGTYTCTISTIVPKNIKIEMQNGAIIKAGALLTFTNVHATNANATYVKPSEPGLGTSVSQADFNYLKLSGDSGTGNSFMFADLVDTSQNVQSPAGGSYARHCEIRQNGATANGGFVGVGGFSYLLSSGNTANANGNGNIGVTGYAASLGYNYGGTSGTPKGTIYGSNFYARQDSGATYFNNTTACEFNTEVRTGASVAYKSGIQIVSVSTDAVSGYIHDCAIGISSQIGTVGWDYGVLFGAMNSAYPMKTTGTFIGAKGSQTVGIGIDFSSCTFNTSVLLSNAVNLLDGGLILGNNNTATRFIDFKTANNPPNYSSRILGSGGTATNGSGLVQVLASVLYAPAILPNTDVIYNLGSGAQRWNTIYASNGTINTSDARSKTEIESLNDAELATAKTLKGLIKKFKFVDAITEKGTSARIHVGIIAQEVEATFITNGLDATQYGLFCYDEWDAVEESIAEDGTLIRAATPAGNRYGIRYEELLAFIISAL